MIKEKVIRHYGIPRRSGRYPWGSGKDPNQHTANFLSTVSELQGKGLSEVEIATGFGMTTTELRNRKSIARAEKRNSDAAEALRLKDKGLSNVAIGQRMQLNESSVRALLDPALQSRAEITAVTSSMLRDSVAKKGYIDVGSGVEAHIGVSRTKLDTSISMLQDEGYNLYYVKTEQLGVPGQFTTIKVLAPPGTTYSEVYKNRDQIKTITDHTVDSGRSYLGLNPIESISSSRVKINYAEDGGTDKDGVIELRRNVEDLSLGSSKYAQVRIGVDGSHYMKGMAMYSDNIPKGKDVIYNTNKPKGTPKEKVFKEMKKNPDGSVDTDNPFGSTIQPNGQKRALNIVNEEGQWGTWSKSISSQVLSKQSPALAKKQLGLALDLKKEEFDDLRGLTNPVVKKRLLESFADDADAASIHLKAAALPRQASHVILPFPSMKENEVYAPSFRNGERVVLIRHPHGGIFEIPELTVNNKSPEPNRLIKNAKDAIGIHPKVAARLSGADFDGDSVLVIPNNHREIKTSSPLKGLKDFDPRESYPAYEGMPKMSNRTKQMKMGEVSNLITDMTIKGANENEIARAVRHSMVVIDAEKHHLNYKQSAVDNGIAELKKKYQGGERSGASTLISRSASEVRVPHRKSMSKVDPTSGRKIHENSNESYVDGRGRVVKRTTSITRMEKEIDARALSSGTRMESIYASHANSLKALANTARLAALGIKNTPYSPSAKATYSKEVATLKAKLNLAFRNKPLERQAQLLANKVYREKLKKNPGMDPADMKKIRGQALEEARHRVGAHKIKIDLTDREWEAIQLGAISTNTLNNILLNTDLDKVKQRAMPRTTHGISKARLSRAKSMLEGGYTRSEIADALGVSLSVLDEGLK